MEDEYLSSNLIAEGQIRGISFSISTFDEIRESSISDCPISHPSQLTNPFLGLPVQSGKCESCGTSDHGKCEGHFGYIQLPIPVYHPFHITELKRILNILCLNCLKMKKTKDTNQIGDERTVGAPCIHCPDMPKLFIKEVKTTDNAFTLEMKFPARTRIRDDSWNFMNRYGFHYGGTLCRTLLPCEALRILETLSEDTKRRLCKKGYFPQIGFIISYLPIPPNCLIVPEISDGTTVMSSDLSTSMLRKVLNKIDIIKRSRSGAPNFESHEIEANDLQADIAKYFLLRGSTKDPYKTIKRYDVSKESGDPSTKAWLEKIRNLFIRKGSGFSSRSVITGDPFKGINEIGIPLEIAEKITFEERVTSLNIKHLQELVDNKLCITYSDGSATYALREGSKGYTSLRVGQILHRRIMDGDVVFINRPPSTHKHSLQAFKVYVHEDHTVKINPLICAPLGADFDGDCIHLFYPQSLSAKAEVHELFSVDKQLLSSHSNSLNLQLIHDTLLSLKQLFRTCILDKVSAQQLAMCLSSILPEPAIIKCGCSGPFWTAMQVIQCALPPLFDSCGERHLILESEILNVTFNRDSLQSVVTDIVTSMYSKKGSKATLHFFNTLQTLLTEALFLEGFSINLKDLTPPKGILEELKKSIQKISPLLYNIKSRENGYSQMEDYLKCTKLPIVSFILKSSGVGDLIDSQSDSSVDKLVQQIGYLGLQLFDRGKFYSKSLVDDIYLHFQCKYNVEGIEFPSEAFGLVKNSLFQGLDPYDMLIHSISSREVMIRSSRGLTEPGTLFKNLMAILRDEVICYDGTVRNICSNTIIQFEYGKPGDISSSVSPAGEPVGVLAATAISNPSYKAVLDSTQSSSSTWEKMKAILLCKSSFRNDPVDRKIVLYLNNCDCARKYCKENSAYIVRSHLEKATLKDFVTDIVIEYQKYCPLEAQNSMMDLFLVGHIHLDEVKLRYQNLGLDDLSRACQDAINSFGKKKGHLHQLLRKTHIMIRESCNLQQYDGMHPPLTCLQFSYQDAIVVRAVQVMTHCIYPFLLETVVKGDSRVDRANIVWICQDSTAWVGNSANLSKGELAVEIVIKKDEVKNRSDAWRIVLDSCLPIIHLIDIKRSIPYAIQQIQDLLGISCAFEQVVQRLLASLQKVSKGVLKEHLLLVADTMACTGNLIGFNSGGYKALFRSLKVQVPFTEATLFRPMKCFEKAAQRCYQDSVSSIVASCSWGKHVAVGTGTCFQIMWNHKDIVKNQIGGDVYDFLQLLRITAEEEVESTCLGPDVDDLEEDVDMVYSSPEHNLDSGKLTFDDSEELQNLLEEDESEFNNNKTTMNQNDWSYRQSTKIENAWSNFKDNSTSDNSKPLIAQNSWGNFENKADMLSNSENPTSKNAGSKWAKPLIAQNSWGNFESKADTLSNRENLTSKNAGSKWEKPKSNRADFNWDKSTCKTASSSWESSITRNAWSNSEIVTHKDQNDSEKSTPPTSQDAWSNWEKRILTTDASNWEKATSNSNVGSNWLNSKTSTTKDLDTSDKFKSRTSQNSWSNVKTPTSMSAKSNWERTKSSNDISDWVTSAAKNSCSETSTVKEQEYSNKSVLLTLPNVWSNQESPSSKKVVPNWENSTSKSEESKWERPSNDASSKCGNSRNKNAWSNSKTSISEDKDKSDNLSLTTSQNLENLTSKNFLSISEKPTSDNALSNWETSKSKNAWTKWDAPRTVNFSGFDLENIDCQNASIPQSNNWAKQDTQIVKSDGAKSGYKTTNEETENNGNTFGGKYRLGNKQYDGGYETSLWERDNKLKVMKSITVEEYNSNIERFDKSEASWGKSEIQNSKSKDVGSVWDKWESGKADSGVEMASMSKKRWNDMETGKSESSWGNWDANDEESEKGSSMPSGRNSNGIFSATGKRLDIFTAEETSILSIVDPIIMSIKGILRNPRYGDGDKLTEEDQLYILEKVFRHHPDKASKMGDAIDYIMVDKHSSFRESRCFYVVGTDGSRVDFSYLKCMENFVVQNYPENGSSFNAKYFRRRRKND